MKEELKQFVRMVKKIDYENIVSEGPENCEHNNSKIYYQGLYKSEDTIYNIIAYNNEISTNDIKKIFILSNKNLNREKGSIGTRGKGIKLIFHKIAKQVDIVNICDDGYVERYDFNIEEHMSQVNDNNNTDNLETLHNNNCSYRKYKSYNKFEQDRGIIANVVNNIRQSIRKNNISIPKSYIICEVNDDFIEEIELKHNECFNIFGMKYNYVSDYKIYMFKMDITKKNNFEIKLVENIDILGLENKEDSKTFYIKYLKRPNSTSLNDFCIIYLKDKKNRYFIWKPNGINKKSSYKEIDSKYLIDNCEGLNDFDYSISLFRIKKKYWEKQKKILSERDIPISKTGVYFLINKDNTILSTKPKSWTNYCGKNVGNCDDWGFCSRMLIRINNKKYFDIRGIKTESDATSQTYRIIKDIWNIFNKTSQYKEGKKHGNNYKSKTKDINTKQIIDIMLNKITKHKPKPKPPKPPKPPEPPKPKNKEGYIYCIFDNTRPGLVKLGKSDKDVSIDSERVASGYAKRYFPLGTKCIKTVKVSNPTLAERLLFEQCNNERIPGTEWFFIEKIKNKIQEGLFEGIKGSVNKKI